MSENGKNPVGFVTSDRCGMAVGMSGLHFPEIAGLLLTNRWPNGIII